VDQRQAFARVFCGLLASGQEPEFAGHECSDFLYLDSAAELPATVPQLDPDRPFRVMIVPGFISDCIARYSTPFQDAAEPLRAQGIDVELIEVGGRASSAHNAAIIAERLERFEAREGPPIILVGYSKGAVDILEALPLLSGDLGHVAAVVSVAGAVNGSALASEQSLLMRSLFDRLPIINCPPWEDDGDAIESLSYAHRQAWLQQHPPDPRVRYYSVAAYAPLAEMSRINRAPYKRLSHIDARNDGQIIYRDALIPSSRLLAFARADHLAVAMPFDSEDGRVIRRWVDRNDYPRSTLLTALLITVQQSLPATGQE
jgi:hypothetical protein